jgi:hypothetical protein
MTGGAHQLNSVQASKWLAIRYVEEYMLDWGWRRWRAPAQQWVMGIKEYLHIGARVNHVINEAAAVVRGNNRLQGYWNHA